MVAVAAGQSVGVEVEKVPAFRGVDMVGVLMHPGERAERPEGLACTWVRKEALLKATGSGLATTLRRCVEQTARWRGLRATQHRRGQRTALR